MGSPPIFCSSLNPTPPSPTHIMAATPRPGLLLSDRIQQLIQVTKGSHPAWESTADPDDDDVILESQGWQIVRKDNTTITNAVSSAEIVEMDTDLTWYAEYFYSKPHVNFVGKDKVAGGLVISVVKEGDGDDFAFRVRVLSQAGREHILIAGEDAGVKNKDLTVKIARKVVTAALPAYEKTQLKGVTDDEKFERRLLKHEESELVTNYKFGLLYVKEGQTIEEDMFANDGYVIDHSREYQEFVDWLGDTVELDGWEKYRAGLDVRSQGTGTYSLYTEWRGFNVMWHVATMLPFFPTDFQQLQRKRHLGNDICMVVFMDGSTPYVPTCVYSQFNHFLVIVQPVDKALTGGKPCYRVSLASKSDVGSFGPKNPRQKYVERSDEFREWLYARLINGERTAILNAAGFKMTRERTAQLWLADVCNDFGIE